MKYLPLFLTMVIAIPIMSCHNSSPGTAQLVNPVIGDISFIQKFGHKPDASVDNELRVKTHLAYAESLLRRKDVSHLPLTLQANRSKLLDLLHTYWTNGKFPKNFDYKDQRKPCFIDKEGTICAVGYLVEQSSGRKLAEAINARHKYDELLAMNDPAVEDWVRGSGLTKEECAMIQPTYGPTPVYSNNHITAGYGISSAVASGLNLSISVLNVSQMGKNAGLKKAPVIGLISGAAQVVLGATQFPKEEHNFGYTYTNESRKTLSMVNIGLGTTTMMLSAWNLIAQRKAREKLTTWNIYSYPTPANSTGLAVSITRKL